MLFAFFRLLLLILYLYLYILSVLLLCIWCVPPLINPSWDSLCFLDLLDYFLSHVREAFSYYLFRYFLESILSLPSPSGTPIMWKLVCLMLYQRSLRLPFFFFLFLFSLLCFTAVVSTILYSKSLICSSASVIPLLITSSVLFITVYLLFSSSRYWVNISCIFSIHFVRSRIIFTMVIMNYSSWRLPISTSFNCFLCSFIWVTILCLFFLLLLFCFVFLLISFFSWCFSFWRLQNFSFHFFCLSSGGWD